MAFFPYKPSIFGYPHLWKLPSSTQWYQGQTTLVHVGWPLSSVAHPHRWPHCPPISGPTLAAGKTVTSAKGHRTLSSCLQWLNEPINKIDFNDKYAHHVNIIISTLYIYIPLYIYISISTLISYICIYKHINIYNDSMMHSSRTSLFRVPQSVGGRAPAPQESEEPGTQPPPLPALCVCVCVFVWYHAYII